MRKLYILKEHEEDGAVVDALLEQGLSAYEEELENPTCPFCGSDTLVGYREGEEYELLTWCSLTEETDGVEADAWFLVCMSLTCRWQEQVERVHHPRGALVFDLHSSNMTLDEETGLQGPYAIQQRELAAYLRQLMEEENYHWKLDPLLTEAEWRYEDHLERVRSWMRQIPPGWAIEFFMGGEKVKGRFMAATEEGLLLQTVPKNEILAVNPEYISFYGPRYFDAEEREELEERTLQDGFGWDEAILILGSQEYVVIQGYHLSLGMVDRLGLFSVSTRDPAAARVLSLEQVAENFWEGRFRRSAIEARYEVERWIKVKGHWVCTWGEANSTGYPAVRTEDPGIAAALSLKPDHAWDDNERPKRERTVVSWWGTIPHEWIEEEKEVKNYLWPIPEVGASREPER